MSYLFGDGFDLYTTIADATVGYWDAGGTTGTLFAGRFAGGQAVSYPSNANSPYFIKSSGSNDAIHHIIFAYRQTAAISGSTLGLYFQLSDGATNQVCIVLRQDGAILLTSATPGGTVLDTYPGAVTAANTWFAFEVEIVINNTTGSWAVRKNGNTSNDRALGSLNTRPGTNAYANKLTIGVNVSVNAVQIDDVLWRSDTSSVAWAGDIRCYTRMPATDVSVQFARSPTSYTFTPVTQSTNINITTGTARYTSFTPVYDGTISAATIWINANSTSNMKCAIFASSSGAPSTVLGSANIVANPPSGFVPITFGTPVAVSRGVQYWIGVNHDASSGTVNVNNAPGGASSTTAYASFPAASPVVTTGAQCPVFSLTIAPTTNYAMVAESQQDGATSYVYDTVVGHADLYTTTPPTATPSTTVAVTTRGFVQKSDAGNRQMAMQLKSGATTVQASSGGLSATSWVWVYRIDTTDPNTSAAWTASAVDSAQIGPIITV